MLKHPIFSNKLDDSHRLDKKRAKNEATKLKIRFALKTSFFFKLSGVPEHSKAKM